MTFLLMMLTAALAMAAEPDRSHLPPEPPPDIRNLPATPPPAIFTYTIDRQCRIAETQKLQGPEEVSWSDAHVFREATVWQYVNGERRQLRERRVKLQGEMILEGELVCHVLPSGDVVEAWIEREDRTSRRQLPTRDSVTVSAGGIPQLGTFSLDIPE